MDMMICPVCYGAETPGVECHLCQGKAEISYDIVKLYEAYKWVKRNEPQWSGFSIDHPGVTVFSMAEWYKNRDKFKRNYKIEIKGHETYGEAIVEISFTSSYGRTVENLSFSGFSWGYNGEGPNGLACVLVDIGFFVDHEQAMQYISGLKRNQIWSLSISENISREMSKI